MTPTSTPTKKRFQLDLSRSRSPQAYLDQENLWDDDLSRIYRLISRHHNSVELARKDNRPKAEKGRAPHLAIAIFGPSGSGKSSLLRTLARDVERAKVLPERLEKKVFSLPVMDPTTWAATDQFLYAFLASALEEERSEMLRKETGYPQGLSPVQLAFQEVNEYLRVIDEPEKSTEYDPLGLSLQKLERHTSGLRLRRALARFIDELANHLVGTNALILLPVDDLDMSPSHLVPSLQSFQSFLTHSRLVPIFTFTDRMPEELIEAHYREQLAERSDSRSLERENRRLSVSEQLSLQFLARNFPVRNRIRLGPAPARVQRAIFYRSGDEGSGKTSTESAEKPSTIEVRELLTTASFLLFGHPDREDSHSVRAALRPSTLRRQIQVIDAVADCHVTVFHPEAEDCSDDKANTELASYCRQLAGIAVDAQKLKDLETLEDSKRHTEMAPTVGRLKALERDATWATIFNITSWSLLNVHRDTLRELGLHLEDLYSWSPREMRSFVLDKILGQSRVTRRVVLDRWFNRTDYRRSQVLSVLAANVFRPWMKGEEPYGDEKASLDYQLRVEMDEAFQGLDESLVKGEPPQSQVSKRLGFSTATGFLWFLDLTVGFYLPQVMARGWNEAVDADEPVKGRMGGNGWDLHNGPVNAIRLADLKQDLFAFGMMFLDAEAYREALRKVRPAKVTDQDRREHLLLRIWTFAGFSRGRFWAAVSLWRGLGLIGQLLEESVRWSQPDVKQLRGLGTKARKLQGDAARKPALYESIPTDDSSCDAREVFRKKVSTIKGILKSHLLSGLVPGSLLARTEDDERIRTAFPKWRPEIDDLDGPISNLAKELCLWLADVNGGLIYPMPAGTIRIDWGECFIRRLHGEYILGSLWPRLNSAYLESQLAAEKDSTPWDAQICLGEWANLLMEYWRGSEPILDLMMSCPVFLLDPRLFQDDVDGSRFVEESRTQLEKRQKWGERLGLDVESWHDEASKNDWRTVPSLFEIQRSSLEDFRLCPKRHHHSVNQIDLSMQVSPEDPKKENLQVPIDEDPEASKKSDDSKGTDAGSL